MLPAGAEDWRQFKSAEELINRSWYIHTMQDYMAIKKKSNFPYMQTIWMEFTEVMLAKGVGTKEYMYDSACKNLKNRQN